MEVEVLQATLVELFGSSLAGNSADGWVIDDSGSQLLILLSEDQTWLRVMISIATESEAQPYLQQLLNANFDDTQEARYSIANKVLWGIYQHDLAGLKVPTLKAAIARLIYLRQNGLNDCFKKAVEVQVRQIIWASKQQGQTLETTIQTLERFYAEGMLGGLEQPKEDKEAFLKAWRYQLNRLWDEVE